MMDLDLATPALQQLTVSHVYDMMTLALGATGDAPVAAEDAACAPRACVP